MPHRRLIVWSRAMADLAKDRVQTPSPNLMAAHSFERARLSEQVRQLHARSLVRDNGVDRSALMHLALAYARRDQSQDPRTPWRVLVRYGLKHAWQRVHMERRIAVRKEG